MSVMPGAMVLETLYLPWSTAAGSANAGPYSDEV